MQADAVPNALGNDFSAKVKALLSIKAIPMAPTDLINCTDKGVKCISLSLVISNNPLDILIIIPIFSK